VRNSKLTPANIVILVAGVVILIGSFLPFYEIPGLDLGELGEVDLGDLDTGSESVSAWSSGLFLIATLPAILGVVMAVVVALTAFANVNLPDRVLGLTWDQVHLALAFQAALMMLCWLIADKGGADWGIGVWLMLLASIGLLVGAVMRQREAAPTF
jgi:hypothetical protein